MLTFSLTQKNKKRDMFFVRQIRKYKRLFFKSNMIFTYIKSPNIITFFFAAVQNYILHEKQIFVV